MRPFRYMYVNSFNGLRFLAVVSTKLPKMHFLDNWMVTTQEGNMETRKIISFFFFFFHLFFSTLNACNIHFWIWNCSKFTTCGSLLCSIMVCKISQFLAKSYRLRQFIILFWKFKLYFVHLQDPNTHFFRLQLMDTHLSYSTQKVCLWNLSFSPSGEEDLPLQGIYIL